MKSLRMFVAAMAMVFLMTTSGAAASPAPVEFNACSQCHPDAGSGWCAGLIINAVGACCGSSNQTAWAWCVNTEWGFYVNCTSEGFSCQCDEWGNGCNRMPLVEG